VLTGTDLGGCDRQDSDGAVVDVIGGVAVEGGGTTNVSVLALRKCGGGSVVTFDSGI